MKRTDIYQKIINEQIKLETIGIVLNEMIIGVDIAKNDSTETRDFMKIGVCMNNKHHFTYRRVNGQYVDIVTINGKNLCNSCEQMMRLQYDVAEIGEYATFEDFVESEIVAQELIEE